MTETPDERAKRWSESANELHDDVMKWQLRRDPQWWKVRFGDLIKKYNIEAATLRKDPPLVQFMLVGQVYSYMVYPAAKSFTFVPNKPESDDAKSLFAEMLEEGIITESEVNYEY